MEIHVRRTILEKSKKVLSTEFGFGFGRARLLATR